MRATIALERRQISIYIRSGIDWTNGGRVKIAVEANSFILVVTAASPDIKVKDSKLWSHFRTKSVSLKAALKVCTKINV